MAFKKCKECGEKNGPRAKQCKQCGTQFTQKPKRPSPVVGDGAWCADQRRDLPSIERPEPLPRGKKLDAEDIRRYIYYEGIGFCIWHYISADKIGDEELSRLWKRAREAMSEVVTFLYPDSKLK